MMYSFLAYYSTQMCLVFQPHAYLTIVSFFSYITFMDVVSAAHLFPLLFPSLGSSFPFSLLPLFYARCPPLYYKISIIFFYNLFFKHIRTMNWCFGSQASIQLLALPVCPPVTADLLPLFLFLMFFYINAYNQFYIQYIYYCTALYQK